PGLDALDTAPAARGDGKPASVDPALVEPVLHELAHLLRDDDMAAEACLVRLEELLGASAGGDVARLRECVDNLEFGDALEPLGRIGESPGIALNASMKGRG